METDAMSLFYTKKLPETEGHYWIRKKPNLKGSIWFVGQNGSKIHINYSPIERWEGCLFAGPIEEAELPDEFLIHMPKREGDNQ